MSSRSRKTFNLYSAERYDQSGNKSGYLACPYPEGMPESEKAAYREAKKIEQKAINAEYRKGFPATTRGRKRLDLVKVEPPKPAGEAEPTQPGTPLAASPDEQPNRSLATATAIADGLPPEAHLGLALPDIELRLDEATGNSTVLLGSSKTGKSTAMMHLFKKYYAGKEFVTTLFAENPQIPLYKQRRLIVAAEFEPGLIRLAQKVQKGTKNAYRFSFLLDDIVDQRDDKTLKSLILSYRNSDISSVVCLQYTNLLAKNSRANVNNILLFRFNSQEAIELAVKQFLTSHFKRMGVAATDMVEFYKRATADHGFIYLHPASDSISFHRLASA